MGTPHSKPADFSSPARGLTITFLVLTTIGVLLRIFSRHTQGQPHGLDDYMTYLAWVTLLAFPISRALLTFKVYKHG